MNILFAHDLTLKVYKNNYYSLGTINKDIMERYLIGNDKIYIYARQVKAIEEPKQLSNINTENIICIPSNIYHSPTDYFMKHNNLKTEVQKALKGINFCVVRLPSFLGGIVYEEAKKIGIPCMVELVGCPWDSLWYYGGIKAKLFAPIMYYKTKKEIKNSKYVVYVTKEYFQNKYPTKGKNINCSNVNIENVSDDILESRVNKIKSSNNTYKIGLMGSLNVKYKGQDTAIKAISLLKNKFNIELHFLGSGDKENWIDLIKQYGVENSVFFDGTLPSGDPVYNWLDNMDIYLQPSLTEGLPRSVIEAMSRGCPVIGTEAGGIPELLQKELVIKKKDYKDLAIKIEKLLNDKKMMEKIAKENFEEAKKYNKSLLNEKRRKFIEEVYNNK